MKLEPNNISFHLDALSDTLAGKVISFIIPEDKVSQEVKIKEMKKTIRNNSNSLF